MKHGYHGNKNIVIVKSTVCWPDTSNATRKCNSCLLSYTDKFQQHFNNLPPFYLMKGQQNKTPVSYLCFLLFAKHSNLNCYPTNVYAVIAVRKCC